MDAVDAALAVARRFGLDAGRGEEVSAGTHVLVRVEPAGVAARVTGDGPLAAFAGDLDAEVRVAAALHAVGASVVPPAAGVPAHAHASGDRRITLWQWWDRPEDGQPPAAAGRALAACHRALATVDVPLAPWGKLGDARARLGRLAPADRAVLAPHLDPPAAGPLRPVHGDAHFGNVLPGPVWHDWEDVHLACPEWDLACLVAPARVTGMDFGHGEAVLAGYDLPYDAALLDRCIAARTAQQTVFGLVIGDAIPGLPERVAVRLEWLATRGRWSTLNPVRSPSATG